MHRLFELLQEDKIRKILESYAESFGSVLLLLSEAREVLLKFPEDAPLSDLVMEPLSIRDSLVGYIAMPKDRLSKKILRFIAANLSEIAEMGYEIESLSGEVAKNYEELSLLWRLSSRLGAVLNVDRICSVLADEVINLCPARNVSVLLCDEMPSGTLTASGSSGHRDVELGPAGDPLLVPRVSFGLDSSNASAMTLLVDRGLTGYVFRKKEPVTVCDVTKDGRFEGLPYPVKSILLVPLVVEESVIGIILANDKLNGEEFYSTDIKLIFSIASQAAQSIKKALLFDEIHDMFFSTAEAFSFAIDAKDPYTYGHSKRVSEISEGIARRAGLSPEVVSWIRLAALLHDIGKIGTPENILYKDGELSHDESMRMKEHPLIGAKMLDHIQSMKEIARWVRSHHERYDGSGYPSGLKGDGIPLPSRIIAIADYYDALTTDRPYRKAFSRETALKRMRESVGNHFDPALFDYFEEVIRES